MPKLLPYLPEFRFQIFCLLGRERGLIARAARRSVVRYFVFRFRGIPFLWDFGKFVSYLHGWEIQRIPPKSPFQADESDLLSITKRARIVAASHAVSLAKRLGGLMPTHHAKRTDDQSADWRMEFGSKYPDLLAKMDDLVAQMQTPKSKAGIRAAFNLSPEELGRLAVEAAQGKSD